MAFFTRPDLNDIQFKQTSGGTLTLSGSTMIASITGLSINDGNSYIPLIVTGGTNGDVWTYVNGRMILLDNSSGGVYNGASPTTCSVGGLLSGSDISGCTISCILQDILVPTQYPLLTNPSNSISVDVNLVYEVGTDIKPNITTVFNRGEITPAYGTSGYRSGLPSKYEYTVFGTSVDVVSSLLTDVYSASNYNVVNGNNIVSNRIKYTQGEQPLDSNGNNYCSPLLCGYTEYQSVNICGIYPYYYGVYDSGNVPIGVNRPTIDASDIILGNKVVCDSDNTICINFNSGSCDYIWFAIPEYSNTKNMWYVNSINNGNIGGNITPGGNLFPDYCNVANVTTALWGGVNYHVYLSNYQTKIETIMELRNN